MDTNNNSLDLKIGQIMRATCTTLSHEGVGICKISNKENNFPLFIPNLLPNEKAEIKITKLTKNYGFAEIIKIFPETKSNNRISPLCQNYHLCGGCNLMHLKYEATLVFKQEMVEETLAKIGNLHLCVEKTIGMQDPKYYRNKVQVPFQTLNNKTICGFYKKNTHQVVPLNKCFIQPLISTEIVNFIKNLCNEYQILGYDEKKGTGLIRHVLIKTSYDMSEIMVVFVLKNKTLPHQEEIINKLIKRYPNIVSIIINVNSQNTNAILGTNNFTIYGKNFIEDTILGFKFQIGINSFYQVNHYQTINLYQKVIELADFNKDDIILDCYCGIGTIGILSAPYVKKVLAVEIVDEAIKNAKINAKINHIDNIIFECNKAEDQIVKWYQNNIKPNIIIVDPPRKGCDLTLLETIVSMQIPKMVYVSCDPATLARDLKYMVSKEYLVEIVQPFDMFCYTSKVETIVVLKKK